MKISAKLGQFVEIIIQPSTVVNAELLSTLIPRDLISESGRALASHQSVLVFDILGSSEVPQNPPDPCTAPLRCSVWLPSFILAINSSIISKIAPEKMWEGEFVFLMGNANFWLLFRPQSF